MVYAIDCLYETYRINQIKNVKIFKQLFAWLSLDLASCDRASSSG